MNNSFEYEVKSMFAWSLNQWRLGGDKLLAFKRLVNSLKFWSGKLHSAKRQNNVILTLFHDTKKAYPSLQRIVDTLANINKDITVAGYAKFKNRRYLSLSFDTLESRDFVVHKLTMVDDMKIAYLHWVDEAYRDIITIDWLSNETDMLLISEYVDQFMEIESANRINTTLIDGKNCVSGRVVFKGKLKDGITKEDIPHVGHIDGLECLILVEGRSYKCLTCGKIGHKAAMCYKAYCGYCKCIVDKSHFCKAVANSLVLSGEREGYNIEEDKNMMVIQKENRHEKFFGRRKEEKTVNFFENKKLQFPLSVDEETTVSSVKSEIKNNQSLLWDLPNFKTEADQRYSDFKSMNRFNKSKINNYVTEDSKRGDPDFMLIDTATDESDSEDESMLVTGQESSSFSDFSRTFMEQSTTLFKKKLEEEKEESKVTLRKDLSDLAEPVLVDNLSLQNKIETIAKQIEANNKLIIDTGCRKKVKSTNEKTKKSKRKGR